MLENKFNILKTDKQNEKSSKYLAFPMLTVLEDKLNGWWWKVLLYRAIPACKLGRNYRVKLSLFWKPNKLMNTENYHFGFLISSKKGYPDM